MQLGRRERRARASDQGYKGYEKSVRKRRGRDSEDVLMLFEFLDISQMQVLKREPRCCCYDCEGTRREAGC